MPQLIECIPNFSEARRPDVVEAIVAAIRAVPGVSVLDHSSDLDHNRTVVTFVGNAEAVEAAAFAGIAEAAARIDMAQHSGAHPRIGATDVVPFVPVQEATMADCIAIARRLAERVGTALNIPTYLYEAAASAPGREKLATHRKGEYEGLREAIRSDPARAPDFGPSELGSAGATVIGARPFLIAYNVYLGGCDVEVAKKIAKALRFSTGGFRYLQAMGLEVEGMPQVSMNFTDFTRTPLALVTETLRREAARYGATIRFAELIGMVPQQALLDAARWYLQLDRMSDDQVLENRLRS